MFSVAGSDETYMRRCFQLASLAQGRVAPNPVVGAVLVHGDRIIGEGFHERYGEAHAEVQAIRSVKEADRPLIPEATMYVSLEPCAHYGKTPPCADLLVREKVRRVVISNRDPFPDVNGKGIRKLEAAGIEVTTGLLGDEGWWVNRRFFTYHTLHRPYIVLKWAQTANGIIGITGKRLLISGPATGRLVHRWRSEEAAILVGKNTALHDDPKLDARLWNGVRPIRVVLDPLLQLPSGLRVFNDAAPTYVINHLEERTSGNIHYLRANKHRSLAEEVCRLLYEHKVQSVLVEGGARTLAVFLDAGLYDEVRLITNEQISVPDGIAAPRIPALRLLESLQYGHDRIQMYARPALVNASI